MVLKDGFEDGNFDNNPEWSLDSTSGGSVEITSERSFEGRRSLKVTTDGQGDNERVVLTNREIEPDRLATGQELSYWIFAEQGGPDKQIGWRTGEGGRANIGYQGGDIILSGNASSSVTVVSGAPTDQWLKLVIVYGTDSVDARVEDEDGQILGSVSNQDVSTGYEFDFTRLSVEDQNVTSSDSYFDEIVYSAVPTTSPDYTQRANIVSQFLEFLDQDVQVESAKDIRFIDQSITSTVSAGGAQTVTVDALAQRFLEVVNIRLEAQPPTGATTGNHSFDVASENLAIGVISGTASHDQPLTFNFNYWEDADLEERPSSAAAQAEAVNNLVADDEDGIDISYINGTDGDQDANITIALMVKETQNRRPT